MNKFEQLLNPKSTQSEIKRTLNHPNSEKKESDLQKLYQIEENVVDLMDEKARKAGWLVLSSSAAYEKTLFRYDFFKKMKNEDGKDYDSHSIGGTLLYLFKEPNDTWIAWKASFRETSTPKSESQIAQGDFYTVLRAAQKEERRHHKWIKSKQHHLDDPPPVEQKKKEVKQATKPKESQGVQTSLRLPRY